MAGLIALLVKLALASGTGGTQDIRSWTGFAAGVRQQGPVAVYGIDFVARNGTLYNHPPLVGYLLGALNALTPWGMPLQVSLRTTAALCDVACALLVFEILRRRASLGSAMVAGIALAVSPTLALVSGYHGNTDPVMMALLWLGCYLLIDRRLAALGAGAVALAMSVKLVPIVVLPSLVVWLVRSRDTRLILRAACGFGATVGIVWGPAILFEWRALSKNVLGYAGISDRPWGLVKIADLLDLSTLSTWLVGPGRFAILAACALAPAVLAWMMPQSTMECVAMSVVAFLVLSPAFGVQYLAWAAAASLILAPRTALLYNLSGGLFLFAVYTHWNDGLDWSGVAPGELFSPAELVFGLALWAILVVTLARGLRRTLGTAAPRGPMHGVSAMPWRVSGFAARRSEAPLVHPSSARADDPASPGLQYSRDVEVRAMSGGSSDG